MTNDVTAVCPTCGGLGKAMTLGVLVPCDDCDGVGRVPGVVHYPLLAHIDLMGRFDGADVGQECGEPDIIPIPKEAREPCE